MKSCAVEDEGDLCDELVAWAHCDLSDPAGETGVQRLPVPLDAQTKFSKSAVLKLQLCTPAHSDITLFLEIF